MKTIVQIFVYLKLSDTVKKLCRTDSRSETR